MTLTDPIGDMFSRIRNGQMRSLHSVDMPSSNFRRNILDILKNEGFIKDYFIEKSENNKISLRINLKYYEGNPVIKEIKRVSKPGRRVYSRATSIPRVMNGLGLAILSTPKGVMSDTEARKNNIGGEIICRVF
ncbi:30S ribosomal protein S8 [Pelagibacteraceae bacterium]|jgi:small subunit ribosomal protein S8|nr:30S ribosomal protein S8 [Pelagibacteraceae bacterium]MDB9743676.1 30S ribosomal protein S8 [Pelagibacteraceae bacterium]MDC3232747.1 30S ribosomal protein S8 [Pelagibacteraceae bacterium]|tara:strand:+ start:160 stop:558 length:399 start_codon:yes stop_codon:yes gene_type:complete